MCIRDRLELARQFCAGRADLSPNPQADLAPRLQEVLRGFGRDVLTDREREACHLLLSGHSAKSSARLMDISPETVRMHRKNLYTKLEVGSQSELFALFIECLSQGQRVGP
ncbi:helix-turn-helix transcriptional regulator, partial [Pseudomonas aeruginosa]